MNGKYNNLINFTVINYKNIITGGKKQNKEYIKPFEIGITVYIKTNCPYCKNIVAYLEKKYKKIIYINMENINSVCKLYTGDKDTVYIIDVALLKYIENDNINFLEFINKYNNNRKHETYPMLYINNILIGGYDNFMDYEKKIVGGKTVNKKYKIIKNIK